MITIPVRNLLKTQDGSARYQPANPLSVNMPLARTTRQPQGPKAVLPSLDRRPQNKAPTGDSGAFKGVATFDQFAKTGTRQHERISQQKAAHA
jgi:hypothetical protein